MNQISTKAQRKYAEKLKEKFQIQCESCNKLFMIKKSLFMKRKRKHEKIICYECIKINTSIKKKNNYTNMSLEEKAKHNKNLLRYNDLNEDDKLKFRRRSSKTAQHYWDNITEEEHEKRRNQGRKQWENLPEEEKKLHLKRLRTGHRNWYNNLSEEELRKLKKKHSDISTLMWINKSQQQKDLELNRLNSDFRKWYDNLSQEELLERKEKQRKARWENLSQEEFDLIMYKRNLSKKKNFAPTELEFINILNLNNIEFIPQYTNETIYPDFHKLFPNNPVTNGKFISPYHLWDFRLNLKQKPILVDIDGSIHSNIKTNYLVTINKKSFILSDFIQFNDSQRPYQTDGLDAYIIKCYNDNLYDKDVIVSNVQTNKDMNLNEFITLLNSYNMNDNEIKEMIKEMK